LPEDPDELAARQLVGRVLHDKWTLERLLGVGGTAAVYLGRHRNGARHAVKVLHEHLSRVPVVRERFLREGYAANRVAHPGVVRVLDDDVVQQGSGADTPYIVMEFLEGESLAERIDRKPALGVRDALVIARDVLDVLRAAHAKGVLHRDLKPDNIFLARGPDGGAPRVKILDFGLARLAERERVTQTGQAFGTPSYMSPEQAAGRTRDIDERADIYSVGATLFRIFASRCVHLGDNPLAVMLNVATNPAPRLRSVAPRIAPAVAEIVDRALAFRREDRYPSAEAMLVDVDRALANPESLGSRSVLSALFAREMQATVPAIRAPKLDSSEEPEPPRAVSPPRRRYRLAQVTAAFYGLLLVGEMVTPSQPSAESKVAPESVGSHVDRVPPTAVRQAASTPLRTLAPTPGSRLAPKGAGTATRPRAQSVRRKP
jgi:eukaryotic-like serine/threonine-protein kinase